jgi:succinate dehydrogenase / fumarate reductase, iron-sulfur subunit
LSAVATATNSPARPASNAAKGTTRTVTLRILRSATEAGGEPEYKTYTVETYPRMSVLDALFAVQRDHDRSLAFRCSCRLGMCGTCAVIVNGREGLACQTLLERFDESEISVRPLNYLPVVKDLAVDMQPFFDRYMSVKPNFVPTDETAAAEATLIIEQGKGQRKWVDPALGCINCGICMSSCSIVGLNPGFAGPMSFNRALTLVNDERDAARDERLDLIGGDDGVWRCHQQLNCTSACPRHLSPTRAIRQLRQEFVADEPSPLVAPIKWVAKKLSRG